MVDDFGVLIHLVRGHCSGRFSSSASCRKRGEDGEDCEGGNIKSIAKRLTRRRHGDRIAPGVVCARS